MEKPVNLARKLMQARTERGWTMNELAKKARLSIATISFIESGRSTKPAAQTLRKLSMALGVPIDFFFEEETDLPKIVAENLVRVPKEIIETMIMPEAEPYLLAACKAFRTRMPVEVFKWITEALDK